MKTIAYTTKICEQCKKQFKVKSSYKRDLIKRFCNKFCSSSYNGKNNKGKKHSEEWKEELKKRNSGENNPFYGKKHSEESKDKISLKNKGKKRTQEFKKKLSNINSGKNNPFYGKKHTNESKAKISENHADHSKEKNPNFGNGEKIKGNKNPSWLGGISYGGYGQEFSEELKTKIRKRDNFTCKICNNNGYDVHHIDYNKKNNLEENLVNLCRRCHAKTNFNRESWMAFFSNMKEKLNG